MAVFSFESGGRRCIKPILEKYQSGEVIKNTEFYQNQFYDTNFMEIFLSYINVW